MPPVYSPPRFTGTPNGVRSIANYGARASNTAAQNGDAINSALLAAANNGVVEIPVGSYSYDQGLQMLTGQSLRGFGRGSKLLYTGTDDAIVGNTPTATATINNLLLTDFYLGGNPSAKNGIHWYGVQRSSIRSIDVEGFDDLSYASILMDGSWVRDPGAGPADDDIKQRCRDDLIHDVGIQTQGNGIRFTKHVQDDGSNDGSNFNVVDSCMILGYAGVGVDVDNGEHIRVVNSDLSGTYGPSNTGGYSIGIRLNDSVPYSAANRTDSSFMGHLIGPDDTYLATSLAAAVAAGDTNLKLTSVAGLKVGMTLLIGAYASGSRERVYIRGPRNNTTGAFTGTAGAGGTGVNIFGATKFGHNSGDAIRTPRAWDMTAHVATTTPLPVGDAVVIMGGIGNGSLLQVVDYGQSTWLIRSGMSYIREQLKQGPGIPVLAHVPTDADFDAPGEGDLAINSANDRVYYRTSGGSWIAL
jgi:hypothetical protein